MPSLVPYFRSCWKLRVVAHILQLPTECISSALILFHRYQSQAQSFDRRLISACLFCAAKIEETELRTTDLINVSEAVFRVKFDVDTISPGVINNRPPQEDSVVSGKEYYSRKERIVEIEHLLLRTIDFDVVLPRPHRELLVICEDIGLERKVVSIAVKLMNDVITYTDLILNNESGVIAASVLRVSGMLVDYGQGISDLRRSRWYEAIGIDFGTLDRVSNKIADLLGELVEAAPTIQEE